jgi:two-component system chemotaxis sensor kinase CheA
MSEVTHVLESLLDRIRKGEMALTSQHVDAFLAAKDILKMQLDGHRNGAEVDQEAVANVRMMLHDLSEGVIAGGAPADRAVLPARRAEAAVQEGAHRYKIELPDSPQRDVNALVDELGLLGRVSVTPLGGGRSALIIMTHEGLDDIVAICSFVLDPDDLKIFEAPPLTPEQRAIEAAERAASRTSRATASSTRTSRRRRRAGRTVRRRTRLRLLPADRTDPPRGRHRGRGEAAARRRPRPSRVEPLEVTEVAAEKKAVKKAADAADAQAESGSIRVSIEKVDQLINLVGELVITQAMIEQRSDGLDPMVHQRLLASVSS